MTSFKYVMLLLQTFINLKGGPLNVKRDYVGLQLALQKIIRVWGASPA